MIPGAGHQPHREAPDVTLAAIADFARTALAIQA
jgi:pimeloyl-ACP methyl ester carboxylesterase